LASTFSESTVLTIVENDYTMYLHIISRPLPIASWCGFSFILEFWL